MVPNWLASCHLWLVTDREAAAPRSLPQVCRAALLGGVDAIVCRLKQDSLDSARPVARELRALCRELRKPFIISHSFELYHELDADALHVGVGDPPLSELRCQLPAQAIIGFSAHSVEEAASCLNSGADYVFLGPVFPTPSKLRYGPPLGLDVVTEASRLNASVVFIGGINLSNITTVTAAGGQRVAAISALQAVEDPQAVARAMRELLPA